jgi:hypothetical protein
MGSKSYGDLAHEFGTTVSIVNRAISRHINMVTEAPAKERRHDMLQCAIHALKCGNTEDAITILEMLKTENT